MKILIISLALLVSTLGSYGQIFGKKKSKNADPRDAQIDSLTTLTKSLSLQVDSLSLALGKYVVVPDSVKTTVDTTKVIAASAAVTPAPADSVPPAVIIAAAPVPLIVEPKGPAGPDSLAIMRNENKMLRASIDSMKVDWEKKVEIFTSGEVIKATAISDLKQLKELLDAKIITITEFTVLKKKYLDKL
jgi:hypothetical protein